MVGFIEAGVGESSEPNPEVSLGFDEELLKSFAGSPRSSVRSVLGLTKVSHLKARSLVLQLKLICTLYAI